MTLSPALADVLRRSQAELLSASGATDHIDQPGGFALADPFPVPVPHPEDPVYPANGEPCLETFVIGPAGPAQATGADAAVARWWQAEVDAMVERVRIAVAAAGIRLEYPAYLTASATPLELVATEPHFDDDQPQPEAGVGLVAIAASHAGPRVATGRRSSRPVRMPAPIELIEPELGDHERFPADRIVVMARFAQFHAGPILDGSADLGPVRNLLVFRAGTVPAHDDRVGSGPT